LNRAIQLGTFSKTLGLIQGVAIRILTLGQRHLKQQDMTNQWLWLLLESLLANTSNLIELTSTPKESREHCCFEAVLLCKWDLCVSRLLKQVASSLATPFRGLGCLCVITSPRRMKRGPSSLAIAARDFPKQAPAEKSIRELGEEWMPKLLDIRLSLDQLPSLVLPAGDIGRTIATSWTALDPAADGGARHSLRSRV
jgi:hypothetical protein